MNRLVSRMEALIHNVSLYIVSLLVHGQRVTYLYRWPLKGANALNGITTVFGRVAKMAALIAYLNTLVLRLYVNNRGTPLITDTSATYTEASFPGYSPVALTAWGTAFLNALSQGESDELLRTFTRTSTGTTQTVYGYIITDGSGHLVDVQQGVSSGVPITNAGDSYAVVAKEVIGSLTYP